MADLAELHRLAQNRIAARTLLAMRAIWPLLDRQALDATAPRWLAAALPIVSRQRATSAALAASFLTASKAQALGADATLDIELADVIDARAVATSLTVTGPVALKRSARNLVPFATALDRALATSSAAAMRHALNGGRATITRTVAADRHAIGWRRLASANSCDFCETLRGNLYREATATFDAHDGCACSAEPVWAF